MNSGIAATQHNEREPRVQSDEDGQHAGQGDGGLKQPERPVDHLQRPGRRLLLGLAQQVVGAGVLEERHVELACLLHDLELHDLGDPLLQALLCDALDLAGHRVDQVEAELDDGERDERPGHAERRRVPAPRERDRDQGGAVPDALHDSVDQQPGRPRLCHRGEPADHSRADQSRGHDRTRVPDEPRHPRHAAEGADDHRSGRLKPGPDAAHPVFLRRVRDIGITGKAAAIDAGRLIAEKANHGHNKSIVIRPALGGIRINTCGGPAKRRRYRWGHFTCDGQK